MIKPNELRIGNLVTDEFYTDFKRVITVESIYKTGINISPADDGKPYGMHTGIIVEDYTFEQLRGIPLTEEWLIKFGFRYIEEGWAKYSDLILYSPSHSFPVASMRKGRLVSSFGIEYVHKLQNHYFEITGEELTIKNI